MTTQPTWRPNFFEEMAEAIMPVRIKIDHADEWNTALDDFLSLAATAPADDNRLMDVEIVRACAIEDEGRYRDK